MNVRLPCDEYSGVLATAEAATDLASFDCLNSLFDPAVAGIPFRMTVPQELDEVDGG